MRITGGILSGRRFKSPPGDVRPTQDRVRESLFAQLGDRVADARVLDLFAGSGALGLEAWSRGAALVCWMERNPKVYRVLQENVKALCRDPDRPTRCVCRDVLSGLKSLPSESLFDIILADPPYAMHTDYSVLEKLLHTINARGLLARHGLFVFEHGARAEVPEVEGWSLVRDRRYGETRISIFGGS